MKFDNLIEFLRVNGVNCDTRLRRVYEQDGCAVEALKPMFDDIVGTIEKVVINGTNDKDGFGGSEKKKVLELVELLSEISREDSPARQVEFDTRLKRIKDKIKEVNLVMKDNIIARIKSYKSGLNVIRRMPTGQDRLPLIELFDAKLDELVKNLDEVVDFSSPKALKKAEAIIAKLDEWAKITSTAMHNHETTQILIDAVEAAKQWQTLNKPKKRFFGLLPAKAADITTIVFNEQKESDNQNLMVQIAMSSSKLMSVIVFEDNLETRGGLINSDYNRDISELAAEKARKENELAALEREKENLNAQYQNGAIAKEMYLFKSKTLIAKKAELDKVVQVATLKLAKREKQYTIENQVNERLLKIIRSIKRYENQPQLITILVKHVNFDALYNVMNGLGNKQDINAIQIINVAEKELQKAKDEINKNAAELFANMDKEEMNEFLAELNEETLGLEGNILTGNMTAEEEEEIMRIMMGEGAVPNSASSVPNSTQTNVNNQPMMDDVML